MAVALSTARRLHAAWHRLRVDAPAHLAEMARHLDELREWLRRPLAATSHPRRQTRRGREILAPVMGALGWMATRGLTGGLARFSLKLAACGIGVFLAAELVRFGSDLATDAAPEPSANPAVEIVRPAAGAMAAAGSWTRVVKPIALFGLQSADTDGLRFRYESLRHPAGGRDDRLVYGDFEGEGGHLFLSLLRPGAESPSTSPFFIDLVRLGSQAGVAVERTQPPTALATKFGPIESADARLSAGVDGRACLAFRHVATSPRLRIAGWWCGTEERPADRSQLACLLDRLDLLSAGEDRDLRALFTAAEKARGQACVQPRLAATGRKTSWLDADGKAPALRRSAELRTGR